MEDIANIVADDVERPGVAECCGVVGDRIVKCLHTAVVFSDVEVAADLVAGADQWRVRADVDGGGVVLTVELPTVVVPQTELLAVLVGRLSLIMLTRDRFAA